MALEPILDDLRDYVEFLIEEGAPPLELPPSVAGVILGLGKSVTRSPGSHDPAAFPRPDESGTASRPLANAAGELEKIAAEIAVCKRCSLHRTRTKTVPGQGNPRPEIMFVGEAPGAEEDQAGQAFVGAAGQLLTRMIQAMGLTREAVFIGNILKCRPPQNRTPLPHEMEACRSYLLSQIVVLKPKVIVALGATAVRGLLGLETGITKLRGRWLSLNGIDVMPTFHPSYLLRNEAAKKLVWEDLKAVLARLGRTPPPHRSSSSPSADR